MFCAFECRVENGQAGYQFGENAGDGYGGISENYQGVEVTWAESRKQDLGIEINAFNNTRGVESTAIAFIIQRPAYEPGFYLVRQEGVGRNIVYTIQSYAVQSAGEGSRY